MLENKDRIGNFTSSEIYNLCAGDDVLKPNKPFYTYIEEKIIEKKIHRSISTGASSRSMVWGKLLENYVFQNLGVEKPNILRDIRVAQNGDEYEMLHKQTFVNPNPKYPFWAGSVDFLVKGKKVSELKCYQLKNHVSYFLALFEAKETGDLSGVKKGFAQEYWQMVSNARIHKTPKMEAILFAPYESEMEAIRELVNDPEYLSKAGLTYNDCSFVEYSENVNLAVLPNDSEIPNLALFEFDVPEKDIIFLETRIGMAGKLLMKSA